MPKQARSQKRYEEILDAAANLFLKKGFDGTTTNEIASWADISIGSVYQYFKNKEDIVAALTERYVEDLRAVTDHIMETEVTDLSTRPAIDRLLDPIVKFHSSHPEFRSLWLASEFNRELRGPMLLMDKEVVRRVEGLLQSRSPGISRERAHMVVTVMYIGLKALLALIGRSEDPAFKHQAAAEVKRMLTAYVDDIIREQKD
jgi:AcrR family transcriptional regulator